MESENPARNPQTEKMFLWAAFLGLCMVSALIWSTNDDETRRLAALRANELQKEKLFSAFERTRGQTDRYVDRFGRDSEFVRDQARERLGVAEPGEIVIRIDGGRNMAAPVAVDPATNKPTGKAAAPAPAKPAAGGR